MFEILDDLSESYQFVEEIPPGTEDVPGDGDNSGMDEPVTDSSGPTPESTDNSVQVEEQPDVESNVAASEETFALDTSFQEDVLKAIQEIKLSQDNTLSELQILNIHQQNMENTGFVIEVGLAILVGVLVALILSLFLRH